MIAGGRKIERMDWPPVRYATASDGFSIAYAEAGEGVPFVLMPAPVSNLRLDWTSASQAPFLHALASRYRLIRYDGRGLGLSQRGLAEDLSLNDLMLDLEAVVERLSLKRFVLMGRVMTSHVAVRYAVENPERVDALILWNTPLEDLGRVSLSHEQVMRSHWDFFALTMSRMAYPADDSSWATDAILQSVERHDFLALTYAAVSAPPLVEVLEQLHVPTLVLGLQVARSSQKGDSGGRLAAAIRDSQFVTFKPGRDAFACGGEALVQPIETFVRQLGLSAKQAVSSLTPSSSLSTREIEVLRLVTAGKTNQQVAVELVISPSTAAKHVSSILAKTGASNRAEAASFAHRAGLV
jgi:DNA-binding CsgD family transcriptional regulator/pimeloyl-ACP methyl ester carboxylesterase